MKKILAIYLSKVFFEKDTPNFYEWICGRRGLSESYLALKEKYSEGKKGPQVLCETFDLAIAGLTPIEFTRYVKEYTDKYQSKEIAETLKKLSKKYKVMIFSSFPRLLFDNLGDVVYKIFGSEYVFDKWGKKINKLSLTKLTLGGKTEEEKRKDELLLPFLKPLRKPKNHDKVCKILDEIGLNKVYNRGSIEMGNHSDYVDYITYCQWLYIEPDRYGMLLYLIDEMIEGGHDKEDVIVLGESVTAMPMHKMTSKIIKSLDEA
jgi:protoporphyrinogen oxidase